MKTQIETEIEEAEALLEAPSPWLRSKIKAETRRSTPEISSETNVSVFAVVKHPDSPTTGVVNVATYTADELYGFSQAPILDFNNNVCIILGALEKLKGIGEDDVEFEVQAVYAWQEIRNLQKFLGTSPAHDEVLALLQQVCFVERIQAFTKQKLGTLIRAFEILKEGVSLADKLLDEFADVIQQEFDLNVPMGFLKSP